jgi:hypothetical protein
MIFRGIHYLGGQLFETAQKKTKKKKKKKEEKKCFGLRTIGTPISPSVRLLTLELFFPIFAAVLPRWPILCLRGFLEDEQWGVSPSAVSSLKLRTVTFPFLIFHYYC